MPRDLVFTYHHPRDLGAPPTWVVNEINRRSGSLTPLSERLLAPGDAVDFAMHSKGVTWEERRSIMRTHEFEDSGTTILLALIARTTDPDTPFRVVEVDPSGFMAQVWGYGPSRGIAWDQAMQSLGRRPPPAQPAPPTAQQGSLL